MILKNVIHFYYFFRPGSHDIKFPDISMFSMTAGICIFPGLAHTCRSLPCRVGAGGHLRGGLRVGALVSDDKRGRRGSFLTADYFMGRPAIR